MHGRTYRREDCSCLVAVTNVFLRGMDWQNIMPEDHWKTFISQTVSAVVEKMIVVAQTSLERSYSNCGSYKKLPWLSTFTLRNFWLISPSQLGRLLSILERSEEKGLLTEEVKAQLVRARSVIAYFAKSSDGRESVIGGEAMLSNNFHDVTESDALINSQRSGVGPVNTSLWCSHQDRYHPIGSAPICMPIQ